MLSKNSSLSGSKDAFSNSCKTTLGHWLSPMSQPMCLCRRKARITLHICHWCRGPKPCNHTGSVCRYELLGAAEVWNHHLVHTELSYFHEPMASLVEVGKNRPHLELAVIVHLGVVPEMHALLHGIHRIPPDVICHEVVVAILLELPQHFPPWNRVIAAVEQDSFHAPVCVPADVWQVRLQSLLDSIQS